MPRLAAFLILSVALVACAGLETGTSPDSAVSYDEIEVTKLSDSVAGKNAFQIVRTYKPEWIANRRGEARYSGAKVYLNGSETPFGNVFSLKSLSANRVQSIERLSAVEAQHRFGDGNSGGALIVRTKSGSSQS